MSELGQSRHFGPSRLIAVAAYHITSFRKPCFTETIDKNLTLPWPAPGYPFRNAKIGLELEQTGAASLASASRPS